MFYREFQPHPALQPFVENYWWMQTSSFQEEVVVPDGNTSLMFLTDTVNRMDAEKRQSVQMKDRAVIVGQKSRPVVYRFGPSQVLQTFGVRFRPAGLRAFTALPMADLKDQLVDAREILGCPVNEAAEQIAQARSQEAMAKIAERMLLNCLQPLCLQQQTVGQTLELIIQRGGQYQAAEWTQQFGLSERQTERLFQQYVGLSPKTFARVIRFNHAIHHQRRQPWQRLTDLAYDNGYFDQTHFVKEVKAFTRKTPKQYFRYCSEAWSQPLQDLLTKRFSRQ